MRGNAQRMWTIQEYDKALIAAEKEVKRLSRWSDYFAWEREFGKVESSLTTATATIERLEGECQSARCPCGGWLEGIGINIAKQENVYQCDKCGVQLIIAREAEQKPKGDTT